MLTLDKLRAGVVSSSVGETERIAANLAEWLPIDHVLALQGNLGVGKTTLVRSLARAWNINDAVKSPTYNLVSLYTGTRQLVHVDAYRLESPEAIEGLMLEEFLHSPFALVIEWPERIAPWLPLETWWLEIDMQADQTRLLKLSTGLPQRHKKSGP